VTVAAAPRRALDLFLAPDGPCAGAPTVLAGRPRGTVGRYGSV